MDEWFGTLLTNWYNANKRALPWRDTKDPYLIWLSEIILQQTQVAQGLAYYNRFKNAYPDVFSLAHAPEDEVLKHWQGLGYYSRARNLLATAKIISEKCNGKFPSDYKSILELKGIGDYTAAAIASFAYNLPHAVVDGNVYRVLSRVFGIGTPIDSGAGKKEFRALAQSLLNLNDPASYNQAIMEFGSQYCRPVNPDCENCILRHKCQAASAGQVSLLPVKARKTRVRERFFNYLVIADRNGDVLVNRRNQKDIWNGLYEFKLIETDKKETVHELLTTSDFTEWCTHEVQLKHVSEDYRHVLTHQHLHASFCVLRTNSEFDPSFTSVSIDKLQELAFPRLIEKFLQDCDLKEIL